MPTKPLSARKARRSVRPKGKAKTQRQPGSLFDRSIQTIASMFGKTRQRPFVLFIGLIGVVMMSVGLVSAFKIHPSAIPTDSVAKQQPEQSWTQTYDYDRYGNLIAVNDGQQRQEYRVNPKTNRINAPGYVYDAAGNLIQDPQGSYVYDAENRLVRATTATSTTRYVYDGDGNRAKKIVTAGGGGPETTRFVRGLEGELIAEYQGQTVTPSNPTKEYIYGPTGLLAVLEPVSEKNGQITKALRFVTPDHLGTPRLMTDEAGQVVNRHDYYPFGQEILSGIGGRTPTIGYGMPDNLNKKFTGYYRDAETGMDYAQARYFASPIGRFMSPDPNPYVQGLNPQAWNRYSYVLNNPLRYKDPFGLWEYDVVYNTEAEGKNKGKVKGATLVFKKTQEGDNAESLVKQLGFDPGSKEGQKLVAQIAKQLGTGNSIEAPKIGGEIGSFFKAVGDKLALQAEYSRTHPNLGKKDNQGPVDSDFNDCSMTSCRLAYPGLMAQRGAGGFGSFANFGIDQADQMNGTQPKAPLDALRVKDVIRYGEGHMRHFVNVLYTGDDGVAKVFSRSGVVGRFEVLPSNSQAFTASYGPVTGAYRVIR